MKDWYNVSMRKGEKMSIQSREKMRLAKLGKKGYWHGKTRPIETRLKFSESHKGKRRSEESKKKQGRTIVERHKRLYPDYIPSSQILANRRRKERIKKQNGSHTESEWWVLKAQYNWTCPCCHKQEPKVKLTRDHIIPVSKGGSDNIENIQPLCRPCNSKKHIATVRY